MNVNESQNGLSGATIMITVDNAPAAYEPRTPWSGILAIEGTPTDDGRVLLGGEIGYRDLPIPLRAQFEDTGGHDGAKVVGSIDGIMWIDADEFDEEGFTVGDVREGAVVIWATGTFDGSDDAQEAQRMIENGAGVSIDLPPDKVVFLDPDTLDEIPDEDVSIEDLMEGRLLTGIGGDIAAATIVAIPAFRQAEVQPDEALIAAAKMDAAQPILFSHTLRVQEMNAPVAITAAAAAPLHPPRAWFDDPKLRKLTPLTITDDGRVLGHLADWSGCHTGFTDVCVPPFRSVSNYAYFNVGELETADGGLVPVGKIMFSMDGAKHAPLNPGMTAADVSKHYDDATKVGAFVRAGADRFGTWLAGTLRPGLTDEEIQHLRSHPPSGDWRPIPGKPGSELVAAFSVAVPGFPIPRSVIASGADGLVIITGPLSVEPGEKAILRRTEMLRRRLSELREAI
jgi:hypothetical protein